MKTLSILGFLVVAAAASDVSELRFLSEWQNFKETHGKTYESPAEENFRMNVFRENLRRVAEHNDAFKKGLQSFEVGINHFSDLRTHEVNEKMHSCLLVDRSMGHVRARLHSTGSESGSDDPPVNATAVWDWRTKGVVTPVKNQGPCGSCWSFAATGALEAQLSRKAGRLVSLSEQNLIDCSSDYGNHGCNGGTMSAAFAYVHDNQGIDTEASYPYETRDSEPCRYDEAHNAGTISSFVRVRTERQMKDAVRRFGPVAVGINADRFGFHSYHSGIFSDQSCSHHPTHGVLVVGFGSERGQDYWIVKNSWGAGWGDNGYIKMARGINICGITTMASYPLV